MDLVKVGDQYDRSKPRLNGVETEEIKPNAIDTHKKMHILDQFASRVAPWLRGRGRVTVMDVGN